MLGGGKETSLPTRIAFDEAKAFETVSDVFNEVKKKLYIKCVMTSFINITAMTCTAVGGSGKKFKIFHQ